MRPHNPRCRTCRRTIKRSNRIRYVPAIQRGSVMYRRLLNSAAREAHITEPEWETIIDWPLDGAPVWGTKK